MGFLLFPVSLYDSVIKGQGHKGYVMEAIAFDASVKYQACTVLFVCNTLLPKTRRLTLGPPDTYNITVNY